MTRTVDDSAAAADSSAGKPDLRLRLVLGFGHALSRLGLAPRLDTLASKPMAKRSAIKPARWMTLPIPTGVSIQDRRVPTRDGDVAVRVYRADGAHGARPLIVYFHGGGWISGGLDAAHFLCAHLASQSDGLVVSVDYRLAPECGFPGPLHDCYDAMSWLVDHAEELGADGRQLVVMGDSAGGNLAAALCLLAREERGPEICLQVLLYPSVGGLGGIKGEFAGAGLTREDVDAVYRHYAGSAELENPLAAPLLAGDLSGLPRALVQTAELDVLCAEGLQYARRLADSGVAVRSTTYRHMPHGFFSTPRLCSAWPAALDEIVSEIANACGRA